MESSNLEASKDYEIEAIIKYRLTYDNYYYLIKWKGYDNHYNV